METVETAPTIANLSNVDTGRPLRYHVEGANCSPLPITPSGKIVQCKAQVRATREKVFARTRTRVPAAAFDWRRLIAMHDQTERRPGVAQCPRVTGHRSPVTGVQLKMCAPQSCSCDVVDVVWRRVAISDQKIC